MTKSEVRVGCKQNVDFHFLENFFYNLKCDLNQSFNLFTADYLFIDSSLDHDN